MLFVLDKSLAENLGEESVKLALFYIALGGREGKHLIFCEDDDIVKAFAECEELDDATRAVYMKTYSKLAYRQGYYDYLVRRVRVVADTTGSLSWRIIGDKKEIRISADLINDSTLIQKTVLLCENEADCKVYEKMAKVAMIWRHAGGINISYEPRGGGGDTTADIYRTVQKGRNRLCLCIADSDRKYPAGPLGKTAKKLRKTDNPLETLCELKIIEVREIENLIPTSMFSEVSEKDRNRMQCVDFLEQLNESSIRDAKKFIDLKKGLSGENLFAFLSENQPLDYWRCFFNTVCSFNTVNMSSECSNYQECPSPGKCNCWIMQGLEKGIMSSECSNYQECPSPEKCNCWIMQGLGNGILEDVLEMLDKKSYHKISELICEELKPYWEEYGNLVSAWCCGGSMITV